MLQTDTAAKLPRVLEISAACRGHPCTPALAHFQPRHLHQQSPSGLTAGAGTACLPRAPWSTPLFGPSAKGTSSCTSLQPDGCRGSFPEPLSALSGCVSAQPAHSLPLVAACLDVPTSTVGEGETPSPPRAAFAAPKCGPHAGRHLQGDTRCPLGLPLCYVFAVT